MFRKSLPDSTRLAPVPLKAYETYGGIEKDPNPLLVLAWMLGGVRTNSTATVDTPQGEVSIQPGEVWGSRNSMQEDIRVALGLNLSYDQVRYAIKKLKRDGFAEDLGQVHPKTRGKYGKKYKLPDAMTQAEERVNVYKAYRIYYYGDPESFKFTRVAVGNIKEYEGEFRVRQAPMMINHVAEKGIDQPAFSSIGWWRRDDVHERSKPVLVPWITFDIDNADLLDAFSEAQELLTRLWDYGIDLESCFVSFSGRRGFHVQVPCGQIGSPIFATSRAAFEAIELLRKRIGDDLSLDPHVSSPLANIRMTGSVHEKTGNRKSTYRAKKFLDMSHEDVFGDLKAHQPFSFPDPLMVAVEQEALENWIEDETEVERRYRKFLRGKAAGGRYSAKYLQKIDRIKDGIGEGESFGDGPYDMGRENAAFQLACYLLEQGVEDVTRNLQIWDKRNSPPLGTRNLKHRVKSARRKVNGRKR